MLHGEGGVFCAGADLKAIGLARFPQICLREDRLSPLEQEGLAEADALRVELEHGSRSLAPTSSRGSSGSAQARGATASSTSNYASPRPRSAGRRVPLAAASARAQAVSSAV